MLSSRLGGDEVGGNKYDSEKAEGKENQLSTAATTEKVTIN